MFRLDAFEPGHPTVVLPRSFDLADEIRRLPSTSVLARAGTQSVVAVTARQAPALLEELGRLRAAAFPAAFAPGEVDLDAYDRHYVHLVLWDHAAGEVAGSYRLAGVDDPDVGGDPRRLYTAEMFAYDRAFLRRLGPAVELGRSFVRADY